MDSDSIQVVVNGEIIKPRSDFVGRSGQILREAALELEEAHTALDELGAPSEESGEPLTLSARIKDFCSEDSSPERS